MRTRILTLTAALCFVVGGLTAQEDAVADTTWKTGGLIGANFGQVSLTNWAAGGFSSISFNGNINLFANRAKGKSTWDNNLILGYGLLKQGEADVQKTDDRIDFTSKYGREAWAPEWSYAALFNFRTQFVEGLGAIPEGATEAPVISDFLAPAFALASVGLNYSPNDEFSLYVSPVTAKFTIVQDEFLAAGGAFGVDPGSFLMDMDGAFILDEDGNLIIDQKGASSRSEFGGYLNAAYNTQVMENVSFLTKLDLFSNYDNPTLIDVNWDALIAMKVNDYITTTLGATVIYDHDIQIADGDNFGPRTQFRQIFGVGFAYAL